MPEVQAPPCRQQITTESMGREGVGHTPCLHRVSPHGGDTLRAQERGYGWGEGDGDRP